MLFLLSNLSLIEVSRPHYRRKYKSLTENSKFFKFMFILKYSFMISSSLTNAGVAVVIGASHMLEPGANPGIHMHVIGDSSISISWSSHAGGQRFVVLNLLELTRMWTEIC